MSEETRGVETASSQRAASAQPRPAPTALQALTPEGTPSEGRVAAMVTLAVAGMIGSIVWMTTVTPPAHLRADVEAMQASSQWLMWMLILAIQTAAWFALLIPVAEAMRAAKPDHSPSVVLHVAVVIILLVAPLLASRLGVFEMSHPVQEAFSGRLAILTLMAGLPVLIAVIGVVRTGKEIEGTVAPTTADSGAADAITRYLGLRRRLLFLGGVLALIVALAVLATGGLRNTIVAMETVRAEAATAAAATADTPQGKNSELIRAAAAKARANRFGVELVWGYGLFYSFVLVLIYLPAYLSLIARGREVRDAIKPPLLPGDPAYEENEKVREELDAMLQLKLGASESLKAATLILVPLVTSLASTLLGGVKVGS